MCIEGETSRHTIFNAFRVPDVVAISSTTVREDSVYEMMSESREHVQRMTGIFSAIVASFIIESYNILSQDVGDQISLQPSQPVSIIIVTIMW